MKHLIQQIILLIFYLVFIEFAQASAPNRCYSFDTHHNLLFKKDGIYLQETVKDSHNKISYVSQSKVRLKGIENKGVRVISDYGNKILVLSNSKYYFIPKSLSKAKNYEITPLFNENEVSKIASNNFFLVSGNWYYVSYTSEGKSDKHKIPKLKENMEIIAYHNGSLAIFYHWYFSKDIEDRFLLKSVDKVLLKDDNAVYIYDISKNKLKKIPHLTPSQTHFVESNYISYLYDDDTFYLIDRKNFTYTDITKKFNQQGKYKGFTKAEIYPSYYSGDSMDTKDGFIWINLSYLDDLRDYFRPVKATYLNAYKDLYVYHNKVYSRNWALQDEAAPSDPSYRDGSIDISNVKNPGELHRISSGSEFFDNQQYYSLEKNSRRLEKKEPSAYLKLLTTKDHIEIREKRIFIDGQQLNTDKFQDAPIFLGSIVDIISPCRRIILPACGYEYRSKQDYYYFFTDGKKVYAYINPEENQKPIVLDNISPQNLKVNDYDTLKELQNICITTVKESKSNIYGYF